MSGFEVFNKLTLFETSNFYFTNFSLKTVFWQLIPAFVCVFVSLFVGEGVCKNLAAYVQKTAASVVIGVAYSLFRYENKLSSWVRLCLLWVTIIFVFFVFFQVFSSFSGFFVSYALTAKWCSNPLYRGWRNYESLTLNMDEGWKKLFFGLGGFFGLTWLRWKYDASYKHL